MHRANVTRLGQEVFIVGVVAVVLRYGEGFSIAALATPIIIVTGVWLVVLMVSEFRAHRRWTLP